MSTLAIVLIVAGVVVLLVLLGGLAAVRRRARLQAGEFERHIAEADRALEQARAADKGWDRGLLEDAARAALHQERPDHSYDEFHLVLVDDRPGVSEDRAHFVARGAGDDVRVVLARRDGGWVAESVG
jgi:hypothetical protein